MKSVRKQARAVAHDKRKDSSKSYPFSTLVEVAAVLRDAFSDLGAVVTPYECEKLSCFLNASYGTRSRAFHDVRHALEVGKECTSTGKLAALFHDVVYLQVDHGRLPELRSSFGVFDQGESLELTIPGEEVLRRDIWRQAVVGLFGFTSGQVIGVYSGLNEFLSAWVAVQKLGSHLETKHVLDIVACIEATIPFRGEKESPSVSELLAHRLSRVYQQFGISATEVAIDDVVRESVKVSNYDVEGFGLESPDVFIYNSWALLYESNPPLQQNLYSIVKYREPLQRLEAFFDGLNSRKIFLKYKNTPSPEQLQSLKNGAEENIRIGKEYVRAKIVDTTILEAFAKLSGGDCPLELFTGPRAKSREEKVARIEEFLDWSTITSSEEGKDKAVISMLGEGRAFRSRFDVKTALFAAYIYLGLKPQEFQELYQGAREFTHGQLSAECFLKMLPDSMLKHIGEILCQMAWTRADKIRQFLKTAVGVQKKEAA